MKTDIRNNFESPEFREFFIDQIKDIYWAEKHLATGMRKMQKAATNQRLASAFADRIEETKGQIERLERVFALLEKKPQAKRCEAMAGLVSEAEDVIDSTDKNTFTRDAGLVIAAQKAGHYEIATYGTLRHYAKMMGEREVARELNAILKEEKRVDDLLSYLVDEEAYAPVAVM